VNTIFFNSFAYDGRTEDATDTRQIESPVASSVSRKANKVVPFPASKRDRRLAKDSSKVGDSETELGGRTHLPLIRPNRPALKGLLVLRAWPFEGLPCDWSAYLE
jgi:hypothetical protein